MWREDDVALKRLICLNPAEGWSQLFRQRGEGTEPPCYVLQSILVNLAPMGGMKVGNSSYSLLWADYFWLGLKVIYYRITCVRSCGSAILHKVSIAWASFLHCPDKEESPPIWREWFAPPTPPAPGLSAKTASEVATGNSALFWIQNGIFP